MIHESFAVIVAFLVIACSSEHTKVLKGLQDPVLPTPGKMQERDRGEYAIPEEKWPDYGVPDGADHFPSFEERSMAVWLNVARIGYKWYATTYLSSLVTDKTFKNIFDESGTKMESVAPGFWNFNMNRCARAHCTDVVTNLTYCRNGGGHEDSNGTDASVRYIKYTSHDCGEIYINNGPGYGLSRGFSSVASWICDGHHSVNSYAPDLTQCCPDKGPEGTGLNCRIGHRLAIMNSCSEFGCGVDGIGSECHKSRNSYTTACGFYPSNSKKIFRSICCCCKPCW